MECLTHPTGSAASLRIAATRCWLGLTQCRFVGFEFQLAHRAFGSINVVAYLTEVFCLNEFSIGTGMAVEVLIMPTSA